MFYRQISDFEENFKFLDRLNAIVFNVWKDDNAEAFKTNLWSSWKCSIGTILTRCARKVTE